MELCEIIFIRGIPLNLRGAVVIVW